MMNLGKPTCVSSNQKRGFVVKVDGIDGSGKTEAVRGLVERLSQKMTVAQTAEFRSDQDLQTDGGRSVSRLLYDLSLDPVLAFDVTERQFAMAISSHRSNRVVLSKLISTADVVICDRSTLSIFAYSIGIDPSLGSALFANAQAAAIEDLIIWLDVEPELAAQRTLPRRKKQPSLDNVELLGLEHQRAVAERYRIITSKRGNIQRIDAALPLDQVLDRCEKVIEARWSQWRHSEC